MPVRVAIYRFGTEIEFYYRKEGSETNERMARVFYYRKTTTSTVAAKQSPAGIMLELVLADALERLDLIGVVKKGIDQTTA